MGSGAFLVGACRYLGDELVKAWERTGTTPAIPPDEDPQLFARRLVAQRCLYGVDRNPFAVQLAKLSLWLVTLAREHPFTFLDHALRGGDSLVGLSARQIAAFHWQPGAQQTLWAHRVEALVEEAEARRTQLETLANTDDTAEKLRLLAESDEALKLVRLVGDAVIAAFFSADRDRAREQRRQEYEHVAQGSIGTVLEGGELEAIAEGMHALRPPILPFHWQVEFAEVFRRENPGFDAVVGNPPFAGKNTLIHSNPVHYLDWLQTVHAGAHGNSDLVAHFFRRAYGLLRRGGAFGLIATNTIAQGDTRSTGLRWLREHGATIFDARRRYRWPGAAAVVVSVVHGVHGVYSGMITLDRRSVDKITAFLFHAGGDDDPAPLPENVGKSFQGSIVLGMGFTFDDGNDEATPIAEMQRLIAANPKNSVVIFPYIGGEEVNDSPTHLERRYVIDFGDRSESDCRESWPDLMSIVESKVRPAREHDNRATYRRYWWQFAEKRVELRAAIHQLEQTLVLSRVSHHLHWARLSPNKVFAESLVVVAESGWEMASVLQSRCHEIWARFLGSSMKDDLRYTPSDCFETFPRPEEIAVSRLADVGESYYAFRSQFMIENDQGLTTVYNRLHDATEQDAGVLRLRGLHDAVDRAVLDAYGWTDIHPVCEFLLDYEEDDDPTSRRRKPWRYRWPDEIRDEVLARLLELNRQRAAHPLAAQESLF
jgi:hypothetical protein